MISCTILLVALSQLINNYKCFFCHFINFPHMSWNWLQVGFYPRPVLTFKYCHCLCLSVCLSICVCVRECFNPNLWAITYHPFKLETPHWHKRCKTHGLMLFWGWLTLILKVKFNFESPNLPLFWACPNENSPLIQARIFKFGEKNHLITSKIPINFGFDWPLP